MQTGKIVTADLKTKHRYLPKVFSLGEAGCQPLSLEKRPAESMPGNVMGIVPVRHYIRVQQESP